MGVLIDTSVLVALERRALSRDILREDVAISVITVSELLHGVLRSEGATRVRRSAAVARFVSEFAVFEVTLPVARVHAEMSSELAKRGSPVTAHYLWIGATAVANGLGVVTRNGDFARIPGLRVVAV